jgi:hypothetical protein
LPSRLPARATFAFAALVRIVGLGTRLRHCDSERSLGDAIQRLETLDVALQPLLLLPQLVELARCRELASTRPRLHRRNEHLQSTRLQLIEARHGDAHRLAR